MGMGAGGEFFPGASFVLLIVFVSTKHKKESVISIVLEKLSMPYFLLRF